MDVDVISIIYKELFSVKFIHKAYSPAAGREIFNHLKVIPDENTRSLFSRFGIGYRLVNDTIVCFIRSRLAAPPAREPKQPYVTLDATFQIRLLLFASTVFLSRTFVTATGSKKVYHFTNEINHVQSSSSYINKAVENHDAGKSYDAGTIINSGGEQFVTLNPVNGADGIALTDEGFWKKLLPFEPVVNNADITDTALVKATDNCFAIIDVANTGTTNATYNLYGAGQQLLSPVYVVHFKSKI